jgi:hypothetical protein
MVISLFALANCFLIFKISRFLGAKYLLAILAFLIFIFATPSFSYAVAFYQHHVSAFLMLLGVYLYLRYDNFLSVGIIWFLCALAISVDYPNLFLMFPIGVASLGKIFDFSSTKEKINIKLKPVYILSFAFMILPMLFFFWFNDNSYGSPFQLAGAVTQVKDIGSDGKPLQTNYTAGLKSKTQKELALEQTIDSSGRNPVRFFNTRHMLNSSYILFFSPDRGILYFTPIILFGLIGIYLLHKTHKDPNKLLVSVLFANILIYTMWGDPWGGWAFGARYLIPAYSILAIYIAVLLSRIKKKYLMIPILLLFLYSAFVNTAGALTTNAIPPKVEVLELEEKSGREEKFNYERSLDIIWSGESKSFVFNEFLRDSVTAQQYFLFVYGSISVVTSGVLGIYLLRKQDE